MSAAFTPYNNVLAPSRHLHWTPLVTQQLRLRHLFRIIAYNIQTAPGDDGFHYTLHPTELSAPFYTSKSIQSRHPNWEEIETVFESNASRVIVVRVWHGEDLLFTWGVNFSGLVYLGMKLINLDPEYFTSNTVIFQLHGGYFTSLNHVRTDLKQHLPFIDDLNAVSTEDVTGVYRLGMAKGVTKGCYGVAKCRRLHSLQRTLSAKCRDVEEVKKLIEKSDVVEKKAKTSQLLTMESLNKMMQEARLTKSEKIEARKLMEDIEVRKFNVKLLSQERDRMMAKLHRLEERLTQLSDANDDTTSALMENYRLLSKESEKYKDAKLINHEQAYHLAVASSRLQTRRRQLMNELLQIYKIEKSASKYYINGIHLPPSDVLSECTNDADLAVALGYVTHILTMCAVFLQVPLRYPIKHFGSRSVIYDHITPNLPERVREFPLYTRGKERIYFNYGVFLLNKNIAQYLYMCGAKTPDLKATLQNIFDLLNVKDVKQSRARLASPQPHVDHYSNQLARLEASPRRRRAPASEASSGGLNELLRLPEAYLRREIDWSTLRNHCDSGSAPVEVRPPVDRSAHRLSRSLGSYTDEELQERNFEIGSEPLLNNV